jgi:Ser/Thr protein kinase RdoA (MazF antagonist)
MHGMDEHEEPLSGGIAHPGDVVRIGETVRRPAGPHTEAIFALLRHLAEAGFDGAPRPLGLDEGGRETFTYIPGDVPLPPFPAWSMTDEALASVARLLHRYHDAVAGFDGSRLAWSEEMCDPRGGPIVCHADICPENVVFRDGQAVALLDFDFAAPGRPLWDVAATLGMWAPLREVQTRAAGMESCDPIARTRVFADAYGLTAAQRAELLDVVVDRRKLRFLERRAAAGEPLFVQMWIEQGRHAGTTRLTEWLEANRDELQAGLNLD